MKAGDFVDIHFHDIGCQIGRFVSDDGDTVSVELGTVTGENIVLCGIPKERVTLMLEI